MEGIIFHIRKPMTNRRGSEWYRDKSDRVVLTFCGEAPTAYDQPFNSRASNWTDDKTLRDYFACESCLKARS